MTPVAERRSIGPVVNSCQLGSPLAISCANASAIVSISDSTSSSGPRTRASAAVACHAMITQGPGLVSMRVACPPGLRSMRVAWAAQG